MAKQQYVKLREKDTMFFDRESGFTISGGETKALPPNPGQALRMRIRKGALIEVEGPKTAKPLEKRTNAELVELLTAAGVQLAGKETKAELLDSLEANGITE